MITYAYDARGRIIETVDSVNGTWRYTYDIDGQQTRVESPTGDINYEYDLLGRLVRTYTGLSDADHTSALGDGKAVTDTRYTYDILGRLSTVTAVERFDAPLDALETTTYLYDGRGLLDQLTLGNGVITDYTFDNFGRVTELVHYQPDGAGGDPETLEDNAKLAEFQYTYYLDGNRSGAIETFWDETMPGGVQTTEINWVYDNLNRLIAEQYEGYDASGAALSYLDEYTFDLVGNRLSKTTDADLDGPSSTDATITYTYDANDRLLVEQKDVADPAAMDTVTTYSYGPTVQTGKVVRDAATDQVQESVTYEYNLQGRLAKATIQRAGTTVVTEYAYGDDGIRIAQTVTEAGIVTSHGYLIDGNNPTGYAQVIEERIDAALAKAFTLGHRVLVQHMPTAGAQPTLHLLPDAHGSTRMVADATANAIERYAYDAYGIALGFDDAASLVSILYSGEQTDGLLGMQYLRARYYDAQVGRLSRHDPASGSRLGPSTFHEYLYVQGNPVTGSDPSGMYTLVELGVAGLVSGSLNVLAAGIYGTLKGQTASQIYKTQAIAFTLGFAVGALATYGTLAGGAALAARIGVPVWQSQLVVGKLLGTVGALVAAGQVGYAHKYGDSVDRGFAWAGFGIAIGSNIIGTAFAAKLAADPDGPISAFARAQQGNETYPGIDVFSDTELLPGTIVYGSHPGEGGPGRFFTTAETLVQYGATKAGYWGRLQVRPGGFPPALRGRVAAYIVEGKVPAAIGYARANPAYGDGGGAQIVVPDNTRLRYLGEAADHVFPE